MNLKIHIYKILKKYQIENKLDHKKNIFAKNILLRNKLFILLVNHFIREKIRSNLFFIFKLIIYIYYLN